MPTTLSPSSRISRKELARRAGVTPAVITAALSEKPSSIRISRRTREVVRRLARELNYKPDILARSLVHQKSFLIGILCSDMMAHMMWDVVQGVGETAGEHGYSVLLSSYPQSLTHEAVHLQRSLDRRVDALVVVPVLDERGRTNLERIQSARRHGVPLVQLFSRTLRGIPSLTDDGRASGAAAVRHLLDLGHRRILHLTIEDYQDRKMPGAHINARLRYEGYRDAMTEAGLEPAVVELKVAGPPGPQRSYRAACDAAARIVAHPNRPTAVLCYSDRRALGLINGLMELGVRVPHDISVMGFDNLPAAAFSRPSLTSMGVDRVEMGRQAGRMLFKAMQSETITDASLTAKLVTRQSTAAPATQPPHSSFPTQSPAHPPKEV